MVLMKNPRWKKFMKEKPSKYKSSFTLYKTINRFLHAMMLVTSAVRAWKSGIKANL